MLKLDETEETCTRVLKVAYCYDLEWQMRIAMEILDDVRVARTRRLVYGTCVVLQGLLTRTELNGREGHVGGVLKQNGWYIVQIQSATLSLRRCNLFALLPGYTAVCASGRYLQMAGQRRDPVWGGARADKLRMNPQLFNWAQSAP